jgi:hypothetical protein
MMPGVGFVEKDEKKGFTTEAQRHRDGFSVVAMCFPLAVDII